MAKSTADIKLTLVTTAQSVGLAALPVVVGHGIADLAKVIISQPGEVDYRASNFPTVDGCKSLHGSYNVAAGQTKTLTADAPGTTVDLSANSDGSQTCVWKSPTFTATYTLKPPQLAVK